MSNEITECCKYEIKDNNRHPVYWNPYNKIIQCHNCGAIYSPKQIAGITIIDRLEKPDGKMIIPMVFHEEE